MSFSAEITMIFFDNFNTCQAHTLKARNDIIEFSSGASKITFWVIDFPTFAKIRNTLIPFTAKMTTYSEKHKKYQNSFLFKENLFEICLLMINQNYFLLKLKITQMFLSFNPKSINNKAIIIQQGRIKGGFLGSYLRGPALNLF